MKKAHSPVADTRNGRAWLAQFDADDRPLAELLLKNLNFVTLSEFNRGIKALVHRETKLAPPPIALYCVRETEDGEEYFPKDRAQKPHAIRPGMEVGSEGAAAFIITQLSRPAPGVYLEHPSLEELKRQRCHDIFLIDDTIGSGTRLCRFIQAFRRNRTMRSWISLKLIRVTIVVYCASRKGERRIREETSKSLVESIAFECRPTSRPALWKPDQRERVEQMCKKYGKRLNIRRSGLGSGGELGLLVFEHGCSNLTPPILWVNHPAWQPLFPRRTIPDELRMCFGAPPDPQTDLRAFWALGHKRLSKSQLVPALSAQERQILLVLAALSKRLRTPEKLAAFAGISVTECEALLAHCVRDGMVLPNGYLSELGWAELQRAKRLHGIEKELPSNEDLFYYPKSLREVRG